MRDPNRIANTLAELERIWKLYPDMRLGQLVSNIADWADVDVWDMEEDVLVDVVNRHIAESPRRIVKTTSP